jgi:hypothetical protein
MPMTSQYRCIQVPSVTLTSANNASAPPRLVRRGGANPHFIRTVRHGERFAGTETNDPLVAIGLGLGTCMSVRFCVLFHARGADHPPTVMLVLILPCWRRGGCRMPLSQICANPLLFIFGTFALPKLRWQWSISVPRAA